MAQVNLGKITHWSVIGVDVVRFLCNGCGHYKNCFKMPSEQKQHQIVNKKLLASKLKKNTKMSNEEHFILNCEEQETAEKYATCCGQIFGKGGEKVHSGWIDFHSKKCHIMNYFDR